MASLISKLLFRMREAIGVPLEEEALQAAAEAVRAKLVQLDYVEEGDDGSDDEEDREIAEAAVAAYLAVLKPREYRSREGVTVRVSRTARGVRIERVAHG